MLVGANTGSRAIARRKNGFSSSPSASQQLCSLALPCTCVSVLQLRLTISCSSPKGCSLFDSRRGRENESERERERERVREGEGVLKLA